MALYKRPRQRDTGDARGPANEMELSNSTMTQFLGGKKRAWMYTQIPAVPNQARRVGTRTLSLDSTASDAFTNILQPLPSPTSNIHTEAEVGYSQSHSTTNSTSDTMPRPEYLGMEHVPSLTDPLLPSPPHSDDAHPANNRTVLVENSPAYIATEHNGGEHISKPSSPLRAVGIVPKSTHVRSFGLSEGALNATTRCIEISGSTTTHGGSENHVQCGSVVGPLRSHIELLPLDQQPTPPASTSITGGSSQIWDDQESLHARKMHNDILTQTLQDMQPKVLERLEMVRQSPVSSIGGALEESRLRLLQDSCAKGDLFYMAVHQIFCLISLPNCQFENLQLNSHHKRGLGKIAELILPNTSLIGQTVKWFSVFPAPLAKLLLDSPSYHNAYLLAMNSIELLGRNWDNFRANCLARKGPPLVDYIEKELGIYSPVLQTVVFTAIHRLLWVGPQDDCFQEASALLLINQRTSAKWRLQQRGGNPPSKTEMASYHQKLVAEYQNLHRNHLSHAQGNLPVVVQAQHQAASFMTGIGSPRPNEGSYGVRGIQASTASVFHHNNASTSTAASLSNERHPSMPRGSIDGISSRLSTSSGISSIPSPGIVQRQQNLIFANHMASAPSLFPENQADGRGQLSFQGQRTPVLPSSTQTERSTSSGRSTPLQRPTHTPHNVQHMGVQPSQFYSPTTQSHPRAFSLPNGAMQAQSATRQAIRYPQSSVNITGTYPHRVPPIIQSPLSTNLPTFLPGQTNNLPGGNSMPFVPQENVKNTALHQAHLRDADIVIIDSAANPQIDKKYYEYLKEFAGKPIVIKPDSRNLYSCFQISEAQFSMVPKYEPLPYGAPPRTRAHLGACIFRLRCIITPNTKNPSDVKWPLEETSWPSNITIMLNNNYLELRRKLHYGKDLPIDLTPYIHEGLNVLHVAMLRVGEEIPTESVHAIAVEVIEVGDIDSVRAQVRHVEGSRILSQIRKQSANTDPDIEIVIGNLVIGIVDPFTSSLIKTPARGESCQHYECFDLDIYLQTRQGSPCKPEQFRCPICNGDTRPQCLIIDGWFQQVLQEVRNMNRLDARAIVIDNTGGWTIKEEEIEGESGDGTGIRKRTSDVAAEVARPPKRTGSEVIVID